MTCPLCGKRFAVPALPQPATASAGSAVPSGTPVQAGSENPARQAAAPPEPKMKDVPPPLPPNGYQRTFTIWISLRVVRWIATVALLLLLILMFFPWTGVFPGGIAVYTQNAFQMIWGGYSVDAAADKVLQVLAMNKGLNEAVRANWLMFFYLLLILAAFVVAAAPLLLDRIALPLPSPVLQIWPWRTVLVLIATLLAFLILVSFLVNGSGFENAVVAIADKSVGKAAAVPSLQDALKRGMALDRLNLSRTFWLHAAVCLHILALAGAGLELWLERRGANPPPRLEAHW